MLLGASTIKLEGEHSKHLTDVCLVGKELLHKLVNTNRDSSWEDPTFQSQLESAPVISEEGAGPDPKDWISQA